MSSPCHFRRNGLGAAIVGSLLALIMVLLSSLNLLPGYPRQPLIEPDRTSEERRNIHLIHQANQMERFQGMLNWLIKKTVKNSNIIYVFAIWPFGYFLCQPTPFLALLVPGPTFLRHGALVWGCCLVQLCSSSAKRVNLSFLTRFASTRKTCA